MLGSPETFEWLLLEKMRNVGIRIIFLLRERWLEDKTEKAAWIKSQNAASNSIKGYRGLDLPEALKDCSPDGRHIECDPEARMSREQKKE